MPVQSEIEEKLPAIRELCRRHHVRRLSLFGSALREDFDHRLRRSDLDFLAEFEDGLSPADYADHYFSLEEELFTLFQRRRRIDLVTAKAVRNPYFKREVDAHREVIYDAA